jgi:hypothetical protein
VINLARIAASVARLVGRDSVSFGGMRLIDAINTSLIVMLFSISSFGQVQYQIQTFERSEKGTQFKIRYPVITGGVSATLKAKLERITNLNSYPERARKFFREHDRFVTEMAPSISGTVGWFSEQSIEILYQSKEVLSLKIHSNEYSGGAHPSAYTSYINLQQASGNEMHLKDVFLESAKAEISRMLTEHLRKKEELRGKQSLKDGYFFVDRVEAIENFAFSQSGFLFEYNEHISSHAQGPVSVELPYSAIRHLTRPGVPLP